MGDELELPAAPAGRMTTERWIVAGGAVATVIAVTLYIVTRPTQHVSLDLIQQVGSVEARPVDPPPREWCLLNETALTGVTKRAIKVLPNSRLTWKVTVPAQAFLQAWIGLEPDVWAKEGDGVLFRIGVSDGSGFKDLLIRQVDPFAEAGDRRWVPVSVDLSAYAGLEVSLMFNTNASPPGRGNDTRNDKPVWGDPSIVSGR